MRWLFPCLSIFVLTACSDPEPATTAGSAQEATTIAAAAKVESVDQDAALMPAQEPAARPATSLPQVQEYFEIGKNVYARSLVYDAAGQSVWVGTSLGAHEIDLKSRDALKTFTRSDGLANEYVFAMMVDKAGGKWFGTNGGGVSRYYDGKWQTFFPLHGLADYWVYSFAEQVDGTVWIGTWNGVNRYDPKDGKLTTYVDELINEWVYGIAVDAQDRVWFGTEGGVTMFDGQQWQSWTHQDGLGGSNLSGLPISTNTGLGTRSRHDLNVLVDGRPSYNPNYVFCLYIDRAGDIWAGTWGGGVSHFDGQRWTNLTTADGLAGDIVFSITQDKAGGMWFGTQQGVSHYDQGQWQTLGREQGVIGDSIYSLEAMPDGDVWAATQGGVVRIGYGSATGS